MRRGDQIKAIIFIQYVCMLASRKLHNIGEDDQVRFGCLCWRSPTPPLGSWMPGDCSSADSATSLRSESLHVSHHLMVAVMDGVAIAIANCNCILSPGLTRILCELDTHLLNTTPLYILPLTLM